MSLLGSEITWQGNALLVVKVMHLFSTIFLRRSTAEVGEERAGAEDPPRRIELSALCELIGRDNSFRMHMVSEDKEKQKFTLHGLCQCVLDAQPPFLLLGDQDSCPRVPRVLPHHREAPALVELLETIWGLMGITNPVQVNLMSSWGKK